MYCLKRKYKILLLVILFYQVLYAGSTDQKKIYAIPSAEVLYKISGGGVLSRDVNMTLEGEGLRRFKGWGETELYKYHIVEQTVGDLHYLRRYRYCVKRQQGELLNVDFAHKKIMERPLHSDDFVKPGNKNMQMTGQQMVANVICDMWEGKGVKKCFYKGIPLFTEYRALGFFYREEAVEAVFDINVSATSKCTVPPYPKQKFSLYTNSFKTKNGKKIPQSFSDRLLAVIAYMKKKKRDEETLSLSERKGLQEMMGDPIFRNQKYLLPKLLETMKKTRVCLSQAQQTEEANKCLSEMAEMKLYFSGNEYSKRADWRVNKDNTLEKLETQIALLQSKMKCIRSAKMFSDLSVCMKP